MKLNINGVEIEASRIVITLSSSSTIGPIMKGVAELTEKMIRGGIGVNLGAIGDMTDGPGPKFILEKTIEFFD